MKLLLVAMDGSPRAREVLAAARLLAEKMHARLLLFRAIALPAGYPVEVFTFPPDRLEDLLRREATSDLERFVDELPKERVAGIQVELGSPWRAICDAARARDVDLIVIGSHGYSVLDRVIGTTAAKVVNHADRSVLVVRAEARLEDGD